MLNRTVNPRYPRHCNIDRVSERETSTHVLTRDGCHGDILLEVHRIVIRDIGGDDNIFHAIEKVGPGQVLLPVVYRYLDVIRNDLQTI